MVKNLPQRKQRWKIIRSGGRFSEKIRGAVSILERKSKVVLAVKWHPWQRAQPCEPVSSMRTRQNLFLVGPINSARDEIRKKNRCVSSPRLFVSRVSRNKEGRGEELQITLSTIVENSFDRGANHLRIIIAMMMEKTWSQLVSFEKIENFWIKI